MNARARIRLLERAASRRHDSRRPFYIEGGQLCGGDPAALEMAALKRSLASWQAAEDKDAGAKPPKAGRP